MTDNTPPSFSTTPSTPTPSTPTTPSTPSTPTTPTPSDWENLGICFSRIPDDRLEDVVTLCYDYFCPDEPLCRSLGIGQPGQEERFNPFLTSYIKDGSKDGVMATNKDGKILGVRLGKIVHKEDDLDFSLSDLLSGEPKSAKAYGDFILLMKVFDEVGYDVSNAFKDLNCSKVYEGKLVVVSKEARVRGLGTELLRRSITVGSEAGCEYQYLYATGEYSSRCFQKLGFTLAKSVLYQDIKFANGEQVLKDNREHKTARIFYKKINHKNTS